MCGIAGYWTRRGDVLKDWRAHADAMASTIQHRGPDAAGAWKDPQSGTVLAHRRLSIIDLSESGRQPMTSFDERFVATYNGEVYNFEDIRAELQREWDGELAFRGHSDTEVILAAIATWGLRDAVSRFNGMFAFAVWDRERRELHLVRDRLGIKPLYWGRVADAFVFGSELSPIRAFPGFEGRIDREAVALLLKYNHIPAPWSIYEGVRKLEPGCILTLAEDPDAEPTIERFWRPEDAVRSGASEAETRLDDEAIDELEDLLKRAVGDRMVSDVPLGAFLSGGIDSSTVVAMMQAQSSKPVRTFSIGFTQDAYNEATHAADVAAHLGTDHTELYVEPEQAREVIPELPRFYDEPFADSSQIPTYLVSQLARRDVTVSLSGDGGDELFGGYNRHFWGPRIWNALERVPMGLQKLGAGVIESLPPQRWDQIFDAARPLLPDGFDVRLPGEKLYKVARVLASGDQAEFYNRLASDWRHPEDAVRGAGAPSLHRMIPELEGRGFAERMMFWDMVGYLPNDILTKVDRASMAVSLEARVPLLDHRVVEFAWELPLDMKIRDGEGKWLLRQVLYRHVPQEMIDRPKMGFGVPIDEWLRGPLRDWAESLLSKKALQDSGVFRAEPIRARWQQHVDGRRNWQHHLWSVLMYQVWHQEQSAR